MATIKVNDKEYELESLTPDAQMLVTKITNAQVQAEAFNVAADGYTQGLINLLESNQPIKEETETQVDDA